MVCLGNICRSPIAQGVLEKYIVENHLDWQVDSAGTNGYHNGEAPDPRAIQIARRHHIDISKQVSRRVNLEDIGHFDLILALDTNNYKYLQNLCSDSDQHSKIDFLLNYAFPNSNRAVPDPYYDNSFENSYKLIDQACRRLIMHYMKN
jgi:protein-tyrosine phosphatase